MLTTLDLGPDVLAYRAEGTLEREDIEQVFAAVDARLASAGRVRVYGELGTFSGLRLDELWQELRLGLERRKPDAGIDRAALVTDLHWLRDSAVWTDPVLRGIEIRTFPTSGRAEAQQWVRA
jgi:hypothetical protein